MTNLRLFLSILLLPFAGCTSSLVRPICSAWPAGASPASRRASRPAVRFHRGSSRAAARSLRGRKLATGSTGGRGFCQPTLPAVPASGRDARAPFTFGAVTEGGIGGEVLRVTTLDADGRGSLRRALAVPGPRLVVFE